MVSLVVVVLGEGSGRVAFVTSSARDLKVFDLDSQVLAAGLAHQLDLYEGVVLWRWRERRGGFGMERFWRS